MRYSVKVIRMGLCQLLKNIGLSYDIYRLTHKQYVWLTECAVLPSKKSQKIIQLEAAHFIAKLSKNSSKKKLKKYSVLSNNIKHRKHYSNS